MLTIPDKATVSAMSAIRDQVLQSLDEHDATVVDLSGVTDADLSFVQLVESARSHAKATGKSFGLAHPANAMLTGLLDRAGFLAEPSADDVDFWFHGVLPQ